MANRQIYPQTGFPVLDGDVFSTVGSTSAVVTGIQGTPISLGYSLNNYDTLLYNENAGVFVFGSPWQIPVGQVLEFEGYGYNPVGISWLASDTIAIGDGTQGDVSGAAAMTALVLFGSSAYDYGYGQNYTTIYSGADVNWNLILPKNSGSNGQVLTTNGTGVTSWTTPSSGGAPGGSTGSIQYNNAGSFGGSATTITAAGLITSYGGNTTTKNGVAPILFTSIKTAQVAAQSGVSLVASTPSAGMWRVSFVATITTAATAAAVLGGATGFTITYTNDNGDSVSKTTALSTPLGIGATNSTSDSASGDLYCYAASASAITYSYGYTAGTGTAMQYDMAVYAEFLG